MVTDTMQTGLSIEVALKPQLDQVWAVRQLLEVYYKPILGDPDLVSRLGIAAHELLENAAKYGGDGESRVRIEIEKGGPRDLLCVSVRNPIRASYVDELRDVFDEMTRTQDAYAFYQARIARAAKLKEGSGLGLARICAEAEMSLSMEVVEEQVCVRAVAAV
jgi:two-component sensor histidine kinase